MQVTSARGQCSRFEGMYRYQVAIVLVDGTLHEKVGLGSTREEARRAAYGSSCRNHRHCEKCIGVEPTQDEVNACLA